MEIFKYFIASINFLLDLINSVNFIIALLLIFLFFQVILFFFRDRKQASKLKELISQENFELNKLKAHPLINIVIPAWKEGARQEGREFEECLFSIVNLKYPNIKAIVNAGGDERTIKIAESYKKYDNFIILRQKGGKSRAAFGKIRALNECLSYISEGLIFFIDADCYITDDHLNRMIFPIINLDKDVVSSGYRPLESIMKIDLVRYLQFYKYNLFELKLDRHSAHSVCGSNACMKMDVMKKIGKFNETDMIAEDVSRGQQIISKGFKIFGLYNYKSFMHTDFPNTIGDLVAEKRRYIENSLLLSIKNKKRIYIFKLIFLEIVSIYVLITPLFLFFNFGLFFIGVSIFLSFCLKTIRKYVFFKKIVQKEEYPKFPFKIFIKMIIYTYIGILANIITIFRLRNFFRSLKIE